MWACSWKVNSSVKSSFLAGLAVGSLLKLFWSQSQDIHLLFVYKLVMLVVYKCVINYHIAILEIHQLFRFLSTKHEQLTRSHIVLSVDFESVNDSTKLCAHDC